MGEIVDGAGVSAGWGDGQSHGGRSSAEETDADERRKTSVAVACDIARMLTTISFNRDRDLPWLQSGRGVGVGVEMGVGDNGDSQDGLKELLTAAPTATTSSVSITGSNKMRFSGHLDSSGIDRAAGREPSGLGTEDIGEAGKVHSPAEHQSNIHRALLENMQGSITSTVSYCIV